jgi:AraC-like DNA-binding protein
MARHLLDEGAGIAEAATRAGFRRRADLTRAWRNRFGGPPRLR